MFPQIASAANEPAAKTIVRAAMHDLLGAIDIIIEFLACNPFNGAEPVAHGMGPHSEQSAEVQRGVLPLSCLRRWVDGSAAVFLGRTTRTSQR